jgi:hypothetical protein
VEAAHEAQVASEIFVNRCVRASERNEGVGKNEGQCARSEPVRDCWRQGGLPDPAAEENRLLARIARSPSLPPSTQASLCDLAGHRGVSGGLPPTAPSLARSRRRRGSSSRSHRSPSFRPNRTLPLPPPPPSPPPASARTRSSRAGWCTLSAPRTSRAPSR